MPASTATAVTTAPAPVRTAAVPPTRPTPAAPAAFAPVSTPVSAPAPTGRPPRLRVTVARLAADGSRVERFGLDSDTVSPGEGRTLHALVDAVESAGPPAGASFGLVQRPGGPAPRYEVTAARGFGHWTVTVPVGLLGSALAALVDHVRGVPDGS